VGSPTQGNVVDTPLALGALARVGAGVRRPPRPRPRQPAARWQAARWQNVTAGWGSGREPTALAAAANRRRWTVPSSS